MEEENIFEEGTTVYNKHKDFKTLVCWQDARELKLFFYKKVIPYLPSDEKYNLISQIKRAAISITANIAEGYGRFHYQEGIQFYRISRGSIYELKDHLISCNDLGFIKTEILDEGITLIEKSKISLNGFINYLTKRKNENV